MRLTEQNLLFNIVDTSKWHNIINHIYNIRNHFFSVQFRASYLKKTNYENMQIYQCFKIISLISKKK